MNKVYLGDSVYAARGGAHELILTTENGLAATNIIVLDKPICIALAHYLEHMLDEDDDDDNSPFAA